MKKIVLSGVMLGIIDVAVLASMEVAGFISREVFMDTLVKSLGVIVVLLIGAILIKLVLSSTSK